MFAVRQDQPLSPAFGDVGGPQGGGGPVSPSSHLLSNQQPDRKCHPAAEKDRNFNFLSQEGTGGEEQRGETSVGATLGPLTRDENRNRLGPRLQNQCNQQARSSLSPPSSRLPCWSSLAPVLETREEGRRVPPDGAEGQDKPETERGAAGEEEEGEEDEEEEGEESGSEFSCRSSSSSSLSTESGGEGEGKGHAGDLGCVWERICGGHPKTDSPPSGPGDPAAALPRDRGGESGSEAETEKDKGTGSLVQGEGSAPAVSASDSDSDPSQVLPGLLQAVWTLRDQERFKAKEKERHQVQLTMYRRLALIRWVRSLLGRVQDQQNRLQASYDIILTHRKELLRCGGAAAGQP
ncbi:UPF0500 protein C1orf216 [Lepisosteus oculatus]|uniref:UPF0500 protein C1orf216 n=1 Tax=Lepisosteus oculatus TaxID=7918 RepID=UPI0007404518|nr:PREDICTED: UPF0500 protein C1orf216 homolog [Lepisosteus oculatus]XP_015203915.1 PREDICTED: UPF0500 protein C1orf216 homolog [Lepisosteus oculatus]